MKARIEKERVWRWPSKGLTLLKREGAALD